MLLRYPYLWNRYSSHSALSLHVFNLSLKWAKIFFDISLSGKCIDLIAGVLLHWRNLGNTLTAGNQNHPPIVSSWLLKGIQPPKSGLQALALLVVHLRRNYGNLKILLMLKGISSTAKIKSEMQRMFFYLEEPLLIWIGFMWWLFWSWRLQSRSLTSSGIIT